MALALNAICRFCLRFFTNRFELFEPLNFFVGLPLGLRFCLSHGFLVSGQPGFSLLDSIQVVGFQAAQFLDLGSNLLFMLAQFLDARLRRLARLFVFTEARLGGLHPLDLFLFCASERLNL